MKNSFRLVSIAVVFNIILLVGAYYYFNVHLHKINSEAQSRSLAEFKKVSEQIPSYSSYEYKVVCHEANLSKPLFSDSYDTDYCNLGVEISSDQVVPESDQVIKFYRDWFIGDGWHEIVSNNSTEVQFKFVKGNLRAHLWLMLPDGWSIRVSK